MSRDLPLSTLDRDELAELRATVRAVAAEAGYPAGVRALEGSPTGIDADLWRVLAEEIGLAAIGLPDEVGGLGGLAEVLAIAEELGSSLAPVPFLSTTVLCGQILAGAGEAGAPYLERVAEGRIAAAAITNARGEWSPADITCTFDGSTVSGTVRFVAHGASAEFLVVAARGSEGIHLIIVEAADASVTPLPSLDFSRPTATVTFDGSPAVAIASGTPAEAAISDGVDIAVIATGADQLGGTQRCFDMTLEYIKLRRQFNREIGSFQAIKHRMADALILVEMARSGIEKVTSGDSDDRAADASVVKAWGSEAYIAMTAEAIQLHGGVGFTWEHDAHLYFRRARFDAAFLGDAAFHRERIATLLAW